MNKWIAIFSLMVISLTAAASSDLVTTIKNPLGLIEGSSEFNRMDKSYVVTGQAVGFNVSPVISAGVNLGYYFNRNNLIQLEYANGTIPFLFFDIEATTVEVNYKHFFANTFYMKAGAGYRKIILKNATYIFSTTKLQGDVGDVETLTATVAVGNQWQWSNFTLGCDWIGAMLPISTLSKKYDRYGASDAEAQDLDHAWNNLASVSSYQLVRLYLGASF